MKKTIVNCRNFCLDATIRIGQDSNERILIISNLLNPNSEDDLSIILSKDQLISLSRDINKYVRK